MVEKLLSWKVSWNTQTSKLGETALHIAILAGQLSTAMALIYHKNASITAKDNDNHQAIHHATRTGDVQLTTLLLNKGAKLDATTTYGWKPMHIAAAYGHLPLVAEFITRGVGTEEKLEVRKSMCRSVTQTTWQARLHLRKSDKSKAGRALAKLLNCCRSVWDVARRSLRGRVPVSVLPSLSYA